MTALSKSLEIALLDCADFDGCYAWKPTSMEKLKALGLTIPFATYRGIRWGLTEQGRAKVAEIRARK